MCVAAPILLTIASTAISAYSGYQQGRQQKALNEYNARVSENNARTKEIAAADAERRGQIAESAQRREVRQVAASQRAALGAGGDLTDISSQALQADTAGFGELDALTVRANAAREAWGIRVGAADDLAQARASRFQGAAAARAGTLGAVGTLLSSAAGIYGQYKSAPQATSSIGSGAGAVGTGLSRGAGAVSRYR